MINVGDILESGRSSRRRRAARSGIVFGMAEGFEPSGVLQPHRSISPAP